MKLYQECDVYNKNNFLCVRKIAGKLSNDSCREKPQKQVNGGLLKSDGSEQKIPPKHILYSYICMEEFKFLV